MDHSTPKSKVHLVSCQYKVLGLIRLGTFLTLLLLQLLVATVHAADYSLDAPRNDPSRVVGSESCVKCHGDELHTWKQTPHFKTFETLHKDPNAQAIADRMGLRSIKRGDLCIQCHYTEQMVGGQSKAVTGVSCESCHGAAKDWIALHNDYGGPAITKQQETPAHRQQRIEDSIRHGMRNPANLYLIARSCFHCHTVPHERLVNVGGHRSGSSDFELVRWSQGMVRHNFLRGHGANVPSDKQRVRVMYLVGLMTDLEFSLRATAEATEVAEFGVASAQRAFDVRRRLAEIHAELENEHLHRVLQQAYAVKLKSNNARELLAAADVISQAIYLMAETENGAGLGALDQHIPHESTYK